MKAKIFKVALADEGTSNLEQQLNSWLGEQGDDVRVHQVGQSQDANEVVLTLFYSSNPAPLEKNEDIRTLFRERVPRGPGRESEWLVAK